MGQKVPIRVLEAVLAGVLILCIAIAGASIYFRQHRTPDLEPDASVVGPVAFVIQYDQLVYAVDLGTVTENFTMTFPGDNGQENTVEFAPGQARMLEANCSDHQCIGFGWQHGGEIWPISCLPNSVMVLIEVVTPEQGTEIDSEAN